MKINKLKKLAKCKIFQRTKAVIFNAFNLVFKLSENKFYCRTPSRILEKTANFVIKVSLCLVANVLTLNMKNTDMYCP